MRTSTGRPEIESVSRPSCGLRRSEMSRLAMIFTRETTPRTRAGGITEELVRTPSMRYCTRISEPSEGSKCRSLAPSSTASARIECTSLMTGASSAASRMSRTVRSSSGAGWASSTSSSRPSLAISAASSSRQATSGCTSSPVIIAMSSIASTFAGSAVASSSVRSSRNPTGTAS